MSIANTRVAVREPAVETSTAQFAADVRDSLTQTPRQLPSRYLYDALGSTLFDAICQLPWYGLTRAETRLLTRHAAEIVATLGPFARIVELGSGSGEKLATLLAAARRPATPIHLHLIDVSPLALEVASRALSAFDGTLVVTHQAPYEVGLEEVRRETAADGGRSLVLFLGSNIGNFDADAAEAVLRQIRDTLSTGDGFLLGVDLLKPERDLALAYDDPLGVTAAFNRNLLVRINHELGANFDLANFSHRALWNRAASRMEMYLVASRRQHVVIRSAQLDFELQEGEAIWTESSYKYRAEDLAAMLADNGFRLRRQWIDPEAQFALTLVAAD